MRYFENFAVQSIFIIYSYWYINDVACNAINNISDIQTNLISSKTDVKYQRANLIKKFLKKKIKKKKEGNLRLIGGIDNTQGNVEIFHMGYWGPICDDEWDTLDAQVVCKQLEFEKAITATHSSAYGHPNNDFWMDNLYCSGTESKLSDCRFDGWGLHDCGKDEAAGVICFNETDLKIFKNKTKIKEIPTKIKLKDELKTNLYVRLTGGRVHDEGRVEIKWNNNSDWSLICGDSWSLLEANVICRQLNYGAALVATQTDFFKGRNLTVSLSGIECRGNETTIDQCKSHSVNHTTCTGNATINFAGVVCSERLPDLIIDFEEIIRTVYLEDRQLYFLQCAMEENCLSSSAYSIKQQNPGSWHLEMRRLLRFTARIMNIGTEDFRPAIAKHLWEFHQCHMHYHSMEVFATFDIMNLQGNKVAEGHKASFCLEDNDCVGGQNAAKYACANYGDQGISVNCSDIYRHNIDCQWVDVTDLEPGQYIFKISINPEFKVAEINFENNAAVCNLYYTSTSVHVINCYLTKP